MEVLKTPQFQNSKTNFNYPGILEKLIVVILIIQKILKK